MKICECMCQILEAFGCRKVFGVPGSMVTPLWQAIGSRECNLELILCSHEQEAGYVAAGYARMSHYPVVVITTGGPGTTNCISGIAAAYKDSLPLIYISGKTPLSNKEMGMRQEEGCMGRNFDSDVMYSQVTKRSITLSKNRDILGEFCAACAMAVNGRKGSVHISVPVDLQSEEVNLEEVNGLKFLIEDMKHEQGYMSSNIVGKEFVDNVESFKKRMIVIGWGCWCDRCVDAAYRLADVLNAPVLVTSKGCCCIQGNNPYYLGKLGYSYSDELNKILIEYAPEEILFLGSSASSRDIGNGFIDIMNGSNVFLLMDEAEPYIHRYPKGTWICTSSLKSTIYDLIKRREAILLLDEKKSAQEIKNKEKTLAWIRSVRQKTSDLISTKILSGDTMAETVSTLNEIVDSNCVVTADAGNHLLNIAVLYEPKTIGGLFIDEGLRSMGTGICFSAGMAIADSEKCQIAVTGDGCMLMNGNVMYLVAKRNLPVIFIVYNNRSLGRVRVGQTGYDGNYVESDIDCVDFQAYAKTFGISAYRITDKKSFREAVGEALKKRAPALIEVVVSKDEIPVILKSV